MRINGFEQIKALYTIVFGQQFDFKPQHISLYVFLINQNNRNNWVEWFKCPYDLAMTGACIGSKKTYYQCLSDLQEWGLLKYEKGENAWKAPKIKLEVLLCTSTYTSSVPQSEPLPIQVPEPLPIQVPIHIYKPITNNLKPVTGELVLPFSSESFIKKWEILKSEPKWRKKSQASYQESLNKLGNYQESEAIEMMSKAIAGNYQGLFEVEKKTPQKTGKLNFDPKGFGPDYDKKKAFPSINFD